MALDAGDAGSALGWSAASVERLPHFAPREDYARPLLTHHRVLSALGRADAATPLLAAVEWLDLAIGEVPGAYRASFLHVHPTHRRVRELLATLV